MYEMGSYPLLPIIKLLGVNYRNIDIYSRMNDNGVDVYTRGIVRYDNAVSSFQLGLGVKTEGNLVMATSNRLQYMSNADKLAFAAQMADRGLVTRNELREIFNLVPLPEPYGSQIPARGEYYSVNEEGNNGTDGNTES